MYSAGPPCDGFLLRLLTTVVSGGTPRLRFPALAKVSTPWRRIFSAAFTSALDSWSQFVHRNTDWLTRLPAATCPHAEQRWLCGEPVQ